MPAVQFLDEGDGNPLAPSHRGLSPWLVAAAVLVTVVVAAVVIGHGRMAAPRGSAAPTLVTSSPRASSLTAVAPSMRPLPELLGAGQQSSDVLALGNRVYAVTLDSLVMADRASGVLTLRPVPTGLNGHGKLGTIAADAVSGTLWLVSVGGTSIGAYNPDTLDSLGLATSAYPITDALVLDHQLWIATGHGLYTVRAGSKTPTRLPGPIVSNGALAADPGRHRVLVSDERSPSTVRVWTLRGVTLTQRLPIAIDGLVSADGHIWATGSVRHHPILVELNPDRLGPMSYSPLQEQLSGSPEIVAGFSDRFLLRDEPDTALYCVEAHLGGLQQKWSGPSGPATVNEHGVLVASGHGIQELDAGECLSG